MTEETNNISKQHAGRLHEIYAEHGVEEWRDLNYEGMDYEDLITVKQSIELERIQIGSQIEAATARAKDTSVYADRDWFRNVNIAFRKRGEALFKINAILRTKKIARQKHEKKAGVDRDVTWEREFMRVARMKLTGEQFDNLCTLTDELVGENDE